MGGSSVAALVGSFVSMALSLLWLLLLFGPMNWFWMENGLIKVKLSLLYLYVEKGTAGHAGQKTLSLLSAEQAKFFDEFVTSTHSIEDGTMRLCSALWNSLFDWCDSWALAKYGSLVMLLFGTFAAICLAVGGFTGYYYNQVHATRTGRMATMSLVGAAVPLVFVGLFLYIVLTWQAGNGVASTRLRTEANWMYCSGLLLACVLTLLTGVPLYLQLMYAKKFGDEKDGREDDGLAGYGAGAYGGGGYGGYGGYGGGAPAAAGYGNAGPGYGAAPAQPGMGYGAFPAQPGYGTAPAQPMYAPQQTPYPVPGGGGRAW